MTRLLISSDPFLTKVAKVENGKLSVFSVRRKSDSILVGNIYKGVVLNISRSLNAAFVDIGIGKNAFLSLEKQENGKRIAENDEILVQVFKPIISTKGPKVTTNITLPGNYIVLLRGNGFIGISKQIKDADKADKLRKFLKRFSTDKIGFIARTASQYADLNELENDLKYLLELNEEITKKAKNTKAPALIMEEPSLPIWVIREYCDKETGSVILDNEYAYINTKKHLSKIGSPCAEKLSLYKHKEPIFKFFGIDEDVKSLESNTVVLKKGEYITIEKTEALFAIDVNSGKYNYNSDVEDAIFEINKEAAYEIFNQITLRDMGGLIVIDFIDMENEDNKHKLEEILENLAAKNKRETHVGKLSQFGLVEISRRKNDNDIFDKMFDKCESCLNTGLVKSVPLLCSEIYEKVRYEKGRFKLIATANVVEYMKDRIGDFDNKLHYEIKSGCNAEDYNLEVIK